MLYAQIEKNKRTTYFIVFGFVLLTLLAGSLTSYYYLGDFISGAVAVAIGLCIYLPIAIGSAKKSILRMNNAKKIDEENKEYRQLFNIVDSLCVVSALPRPEIYIINESSPNAFATGISPDKAAVAVTTGLLEILNREELEGVIAHELAHIKNFDIRLSTIAIGLIAVLVYLADLITSFFSFKDNKNPVLQIIALLFVVLSPLLGQIVQFCLSRNREYLADATAVKFSRNPMALASALMKIAQHSAGMKTSKSTQTLFIANPNVNYLKRPSSSEDVYIPNDALTNEELLKLLKKEKTSLFSTHPRIYDRISRLSKM